MDGPRAGACAADASGLEIARAFVDCLVRQDFGGLADALASHIHLRALLPGALMEWTGAPAVGDRFARWFGDTVHFEHLESAVDQIGDRTHLRWRFRLQAERLGSGSYVVEQQAYADADERGQIARLDLLCTGYLPEHADV